MDTNYDATATETVRLSSTQPVKTYGSHGLSWIWLVNIICYVLYLVVNIVGTTGALSYGNTNASVSNKYPSIVTPAGWTFSIWGLIFALQGIFVVWQSLPAHRQSPLVTRGLGIWFSVSMILPSIWTFAFNFEQLSLSTLLLALAWASIAAMYFGLAGISTTVCLWDPLCRHEDDNIVLNRIEYVVVQAPLSIYFGWVTAATLVGTGAAEAWQSIGSAVGVSMVPLVVATLIFAIRCDYVYCFTLMWALIGVSSNMVAKKVDPAASNTATVVAVYCGVLGLIALVMRVIKWKKK